MNEFAIVTTINRPVEDVWALLLNFNRIPEWNPAVTKVRLTTAGSFGVGSTAVYTGRFLGRAFDSPSTCTEYIANERYATKSTGGPFHLEIENTLQGVESGTKLTALYRGESHGFVKLAESVVVRLMKKQMEAAAENLKALLEVDASPPARN